MRAAGAEGRTNHAPRSTSKAKAARIGLLAKVQRLLAPKIRGRTRVPVDQESDEEQGFGCRRAHLGNVG